MDGTAVNILIYHLRGRWALCKRAPWLPTISSAAASLISLGMVRSRLARLRLIVRTPSWLNREDAD
jgi:hypothetical protein